MPPAYHQVCLLYWLSSRLVQKLGLSIFKRASLRNNPAQFSPWVIISVLVLWCYLLQHPVNGDPQVYGICLINVWKMKGSIFLLDVWTVLFSLAFISLGFLVHVLFIICFHCCARWRCIVAFVKVLTMVITYVWFFSLSDFSSHQHHDILLVFFRTWVWTQSLAFAKQVFYYLILTLSTFCFRYFSDRISCFCLGWPPVIILFTLSLKLGWQATSTTLRFVLVEMGSCKLFAQAGLKLWSSWSLCTSQVAGIIGVNHWC
jgi:hypothetical protein